MLTPCLSPPRPPFGKRMGAPSRLATVRRGLLHPPQRKKPSHGWKALNRLWATWMMKPRLPSPM